MHFSIPSSAAVENSFRKFCATTYVLFHLQFLFSFKHRPLPRENAEADEAPSLTKTAQLCHNRLQPQNLAAKAQEHYQTCGPGKIIRGSKEKMVYLRERKALKTIGMVVLGFIICWMPFFVLYLIEVFVEHVIEGKLFSLFSELFLWLGYSNSALQVLNPIIYTMYNGDFRRCFRDLLSFGCIQHHRRTMSVKKLHQQSTIF
ncbi:Octopamine receptor 1 [Toxocara canis]|uniref:Octopamine receptor 1 n=1 Tax=Toxocara canis TaxID=6265 RepID=A0A0B2VCQ6_TOXCA|nr:Octopamine receptor 1 [Toxocara canis]